MNRESFSPLAFIIELLNPPMLHQNENVHKLFSELKDSYMNFNRPSDNITELSLIEKNTQEVKKLIIRNDKIIVLNDLTTATLQSFWKNTSDIIKKTVSILNIPLFFFRQYTVRFTASPLVEKDSRLFLGNNICGLNDEKLKPFGRPIHGFGFRFVIPPIQNEPNEYNIRIESLLRDPGKIFLENQARFLAPLELKGEYLTALESEIVKTYNYLKENICQFLEQYNVK